jgi:hypothetical protein
MVAGSSPAGGIFRFGPVSPLPTPALLHLPNLPDMITHPRVIHFMCLRT